MTKLSLTFSSSKTRYVLPFISSIGFGDLWERLKQGGVFLLLGGFSALSCEYL